MNIRELENRLRENVWRALHYIGYAGYFIHHEQFTLKVSDRIYELPVVSTLSIINALVPKGTALLYGGYGAGKTTLLKILGRMLAGESLNEIEGSIIRAHPQLTEEKIVARLNLGALLKEGEEEVIWKKFVNTFWKIIDEVNRLNPQAQDILLSLLNEGIIKYFDSIVKVRNFVLYATINPGDIGTFDLGLPFLDRFGIAIPVTNPSLDSLLEITYNLDERLYDWDNTEIPTFLNKNDLLVIWGLVDSVILTEEGRLFISSLTRDLSLCIRGPKEIGSMLNDENFCRGCKFFTKNNLCNKVLVPLSVRAARDLIRYSKAMSWMLGLREVPIEIINLLAPYVIWHRLKFSENVVNNVKNKIEAAKEIVSIAFKNFMKRKGIYDTILAIQRGVDQINITQDYSQLLNEDLVYIMDIAPLIKLMIDYRYSDAVKKLNNVVMNGNPTELKNAINELKKNLPPVLMNKLERFLNRLLKRNREIIITDFKSWKSNLDHLSTELGLSHKKLRNTLNVPNFERIKINSYLIVDIKTFSSSAEAPVFIEIYGLGPIKTIYEQLKAILGLINSAKSTNEITI